MVVSPYFEKVAFLHAKEEFYHDILIMRWNNSSEMYHPTFYYWLN